MATSVFHLLHANSNDQRRFVSDSRSRRRPECLENTGSSSPGQRRYRNSFHRCSTFPGENLLLPGFSPTTATRRFTASITICHHRAVPECVPASLPVARCSSVTRRARQNTVTIDIRTSIDRRSHGTPFFSQSPLSFVECWTTGRDW